MKNYKLITTGLIGITACSGLALTSIYTYADDSAVDTTTITVPVSCTMSGNIATGQEHSATLQPGTYSGASGSGYENGIGKTTLTTFCNDDNGFSIYAIGFTGDDYGITTLVGQNTNLAINTKVYESTDTSSNWSMKVTKVTDSTQSYNPTNMSITNSFDNWHVVPDTYTKVAEYKATTGTSTTDTTLGAKVETTYAAYVSASQPADTYTGKVKYTMVHPYDEATPTTPIYMQDVTDEQLANLMPNEFDSVILYDKRDESDYTVANLAGAYWMTQNLRIQGTLSAELSNFDGEDFNVSQYDFKTDGKNWGDACYSTTSEGGGLYNPCIHIPDVDDLADTHLTAKEIGAWYNYVAATAGTISGGNNNTEASSDICPANWHLPNHDNNASDGSINSIRYNSSQAIKAAFLPVVGGRFNGGYPSSTAMGYWWSSGSASGEYRYFMNYDGGSWGINGLSRYYGFYIRCVR